MNSVKHVSFNKNFNKSGETPNEIPPIDPNNASIRTYKNRSILKQINVSK